jgi:hypothetical protein
MVIPHKGMNWFEGYSMRKSFLGKCNIAKMYQIILAFQKSSLG